MSTTLISFLIWAFLCGVALLGLRLRALLPKHLLDAETGATVKSAIGLVASMSAMLLGLLINSAKNSYDTVGREVVQLAVTITSLDRVLGLYGPDAASLRSQCYHVAESGMQHLWSGAAGDRRDLEAGNTIYVTLENLSPRDDVQRALKGHATRLALDLASVRSLLRAQALASIPSTLLVIVTVWLGIIFLSFGLLAPSNATAKLAFLVSAWAVAWAMFLILEMDRPFTGLICISSEPVAQALSQIGKQSP